VIMRKCMLGIKERAEKGTDEQLSGPTAHRLQAQSVAGTKHSS
jgi:hypothetical protein